MLKELTKIQAPKNLAALYQKNGQQKLNALAPLTGHHAASSATMMGVQSTKGTMNPINPSMARLNRDMDEESILKDVESFR